jgi:hypothetical protein
MDGTVLQQGTFTSAGTPVVLQLVEGVDWIRTKNITQIRAQNPNTGYEFFWQKASTNQMGGLGLWEAFETRSNADSTATNIVITDRGFNPIDATNNVPSAPIAITAISAGNPPIVSTPDTSDLVEGSIIEIVNVAGAQQFGGMLFTVDTIVDNTSFRLPFAPQIVAGTTGFYRIVPDDAIFFPRRRFITNIVPGATTRVTESVEISRPHIPGMFLRLNVPPIYGSISQNINGLGGTIIGIDDTTNSSILDLDSTGMGSFSFPLSADVPFTQAQTIPVGYEVDLGFPQGGTENRAAFGIELDIGADGPAGVEGDVIYWQAGTEFNDESTERNIT